MRGPESENASSRASWQPGTAWDSGGTPWEGCRACRLAGMDVWRQSERRAHNLLAAAGLGQSQWPMSSSKKSNILTKAKLHTYVEL